MTGTFWKSLFVVFAGAVVSIVIEHYLPPRSHQFFRLDWGTAVDGCIVLACYRVLCYIHR